MNNYLLLFTFFFFISCNSPEKSDKKIYKEDLVENNIPQDEVLDKETDFKKNRETKEEKMLFNKKVLFGNVEIYLKENKGKLSIKSNNEFVEDKSIGIKGFIDSFIETDVDKNGYNEFYCVSNVGDIIAFTSFKNKSFGEISILKKPFDFYKDCNEVKSWEVKNKSLSITFSTYNDALKIVRYKLIQGENSYQMIAE